MEHGHEKFEIENIFKPGHGGYGDGFGFGGFGGGGALGGLLVGALLRNGGNGLFGGNDGGGCASAVALTAKLGEIQSEIGSVAANTNSNIGSLALGISQAFATTNAAVAGVSREVCEAACDVKSAVFTDGAATRALITSLYQTQQSEKINELNSRLAAIETHRHVDHRSRGVEVEVTQQVNQQQAQAQLQGRLDNMERCFHSLFSEIQQLNRTTNQAINFGGTQLASPTNTSNQVGRTG